MIMFSFLKGEQVRHINSGHVFDVRFHNGKLFCEFVRGGKGNFEIQVYDTRTWDRIRVIKSPCECFYRNGHTLHVGSEHITLACGDTNIIRTMTHQGKHVHITKRGEFILPRLCHTDSDAVLVADGNCQLQLRHAGEWSRVLLEPWMEHPIDAVYAAGSLFVLTGYYGFTKRIIQYIRYKDWLRNRLNLMVYNSLIEYLKGNDTTKLHE